MVLQAAVSFIYGTIQGSWMVAGIALKYVLVLQFFYAFREDGDFIENLRSEIDEYSRELVAAIIGLGLIVSLTGFTSTPVFESFSYLLAVIYFGYLFWSF